jgi:hypothetical protein
MYSILQPHACSYSPERAEMSPEQIRTGSCSTEQIMRHPHFRRGFDDIRAGRRFDYDVDDDRWAYERGRLFGAIAPLSMPLFDDGKRLNPKAVKLFDAAYDRKLIR